MHAKMLIVAFVAFGLSVAAAATKIVLPQERTAYYCDEPVELAVAGLAEAETVAVEIVPANKAQSPVKFSAKGDGSTLHFIVPALALAPGKYSIRANGKDAGVGLTISAGVNVSPMHLSQTIGWSQLAASKANFILSNAFSFGRLGRDGMPNRDPRGRLSTGLRSFQRAIEMDLPTICYMYWTGYVTHKPWGAEKSWANATMDETMRLFSLHVGQRLRRFDRNILCVGTLDEPGLSWGRTPAGGMASGFPNWDEHPWYAARGWQYTDDPAARPAADWMKYMTIRCAILKENNAWARTDLRASWPDVVFSTDLYAVHAIMDGTDPMNQQVNDIPSTHVFLDWGINRLGVISSLYLEKAHDPLARIAHAMNGQLFGKTVPQPTQSDTYRLMLNGMLAAGLRSNWWLNTRGMKPAELGAVNEPGQRLGPLFLQVNSTGHDVAVLWSFTEIAMREKDMAAKEARKKSGEQIKLMVADLPESSATAKGSAEINVNAYSIGQNYKEQVLFAHYALTRGGYPAHIIDERLIPGGILKHYRTLVIVGQTFPVPPAVNAALDAFVDAGGRIVVDKTTTVKFRNPVVTDADFKDPAYHWGALWAQKPEQFKSKREASYFKTNCFMDEPVRKAITPMKAAMAKTSSRPVLETDSPWLAAERHVGGDGMLYMVINGFDKLPEIAADQEYFIYNYAPYSATFTLKKIPAGSAVYCIEGPDWRKVSKLADPAAPRNAQFAAGEMKLYLVAPRAPAGITLSCRAVSGRLNVSARLRGLKMPWPLAVAVVAPDGKPLYHVYRAMDASGDYAEVFPIGRNAPAGAYTVKVESPVGPLSAEAKATLRAAETKPKDSYWKVRVFDQKTIEAFLASRPDITIALGGPAQKPLADRLAKGLRAAGLHVNIADEKTLIERVRYPRVWDPYIRVHKPIGETRKAEDMKVTRTVKIETAAGGRTVVTGPDGKHLDEKWEQPGTLAVVIGAGYIDLPRERFYEAGCEIYCPDPKVERLKRRRYRGPVVVKGQVVQVKATEEARREWSRPWRRLYSYVGTDKLCAQLPEAYRVDAHIILLGDSKSGELAAALQASELLPRIVDDLCPGPGKSLITFAWSPFALHKNVILVGAADEKGLLAGIDELLRLAPTKR